MQKLNKGFCFDPNTKNEARKVTSKNTIFIRISILKQNLFRVKSSKYIKLMK